MILGLQLVQTTAIVAVLLFTGSAGFFALARQQRFQNYFDAISAFVDLSKMRIEKPELPAKLEAFFK